MDKKVQSSSYKKVRGLLLVAVSAGILCTAGGYMAQAQIQMPLPSKDMFMGHSLLKQAAYGESISKGAVGTSKLSDSSAINTFYELREHKPYWTDSRSNLQNSRDVLGLMQDSWTHGLNPAEYHVDDIAALLADENRDETRLELLMTDAVSRYGRDITGMRVNPASAGEKGKFWRQPLAFADVLTRLSDSSDPKKTLEDLAPHGVFYERLREELVRLNREDAKLGGTQIKLSGKTFRPGDRSAGVADLRARLGVAYDSAQGPEEFYDDKTASAMMNFQRDNGLEPDGVIGPRTLALLNRSHRDQMEQVIANLERLRWMDQNKPDRYILVNIPSQRLWAVEKGKVVHEMDVIVGKPERQTMAFKAEVQGIRFNPKWHVPQGIKVKDFLPKLRQDPNYLAHKGIEIYDGGRNVDGNDIDWSNMSGRDMSRLSMVQSQGSHNALGRIRVLMPNEFDIYLHDTNTPEYFEKTQRTLSSGCVRLSHPEDIARFVLSRNEGWTEEKMDATIERGATVEVASAEPFPVYLVYQTMWLDSDGRLVYGADVYKRDNRLIKALAQNNDYHIPESGRTRMAEAGELSPQKF